MDGETREPPFSSALFQEYRIPFILLLSGVVVIAAAVVVFAKTMNTNEPIRFSSDIGQSASQSSEIMIDIGGAVQSPGVYMLPVGSRVTDAIVAAGGESAEIDLERMEAQINRASFLTDGMKIIIPKKVNGLLEQDNSLYAEDPVIHINTASSTQLDLLPGVGEVTAKKIIEARPYGSVDELVTKHIISSSLYDKLKSQLAL